jgi:hypothetical protein
MKEPKQAVITLRLVLDSVTGKFFVPEEKISKLIANIDYVLQKNDNGRLVVRKVARVVGSIIAMRRAIFQVRWSSTAQKYQRSHFSRIRVVGVFVFGNRR